MAEERNIQDLQLYGAEDFEELDAILDALEKTSATGLSTTEPKAE